MTTPTEKVIEQTITRKRYVRRLVLEQKSCALCGKRFEGIRKRKFCSTACQNKADYERHAEQYRKTRMEKYYAEKKATLKK